MSNISPLIKSTILYETSFQNDGSLPIENIRNKINFKTSEEELHSVPDYQNTLNISDIRNKSTDKSEMNIKQNCSELFARTPNKNKHGIKEIMI